MSDEEICIHCCEPTDELNTEGVCPECVEHMVNEEAYEDSIAEEEDCYDCRGTGIGNPHVDGSRCPTCGGSGVPRRERDSTPPSEPPSSYRGP
jgi:DnaJ-class molecular chaperone